MGPGAGPGTRGCPAPRAAPGPAGQHTLDELVEALIQCLPGWLPDG